MRGIWEQFGGRLHPFEVIFNKNNLIPVCFLFTSGDTATNGRGLGSISECPCIRISFKGSFVPMNARDLGSSLGVRACA